LLLALTLGRPEVQRLFKHHLLPEDQFLNSWYETSEFLTICASVYGELPEPARRSFRDNFNGMFNNPQGLIPLSHEMLTAHRLTQDGFKVEFIELSGDDRYDFRISKGGVAVQLDCKSVSNDNGLFFDTRTGKCCLSSCGRAHKAATKRVQWQNRPFSRLQTETARNSTSALRLKGRFPQHLTRVLRVQRAFNATLCPFQMR
jgi:hypothetical protein